MDLSGEEQLPNAVKSGPTEKGEEVLRLLI